MAEASLLRRVVVVLLKGDPTARPAVDFGIWLLGPGRRFYFASFGAASLPGMWHGLVRSVIQKWFIPITSLSHRRTRTMPKLDKYVKLCPWLPRPQTKISTRPRLLGLLAEGSGKRQPHPTPTSSMMSWPPSLDSSVNSFWHTVFWVWFVVGAAGFWEGHGSPRNLDGWP
jgi:hypothetical protein